VVSSFLITLSSFCLGALLGSVFISTSKLRITKKQSLAMAAAVIATAGLLGVVGGDAAETLAQGLAFAIALVLVPRAIIAFRETAAAANERRAR
jgi:hypothetical protein